MAEHVIELINICKSFNKFIVLDDINLAVKKNEFLTLLGPSGCGKTTMLRIVAGFEAPISGNIMFNDKSILNLPPYKRNINTVFQKYALFTNMNVFENVAFALVIKKISRSIIKEKVSYILKLVNLSGFEDRSIESLSGGQQQRVAIARALVNRPSVLLLDEPLGALDLKLRKSMQIELKNMQRTLGITFIYVTHDQEEALTMSDTIVVMNNARIQQIGSAEYIYNEPKNRFVADFIGESNIILGVMKEDFIVEFCGEVFNCVDKGFAKDEEVDVVIRPEDIDILKENGGKLPGRVKNVMFKGVHYEILVDTNGFLWKIHSTDSANKGDRVSLSIDHDLIHVMRRA
jgi:spermidine/putrescine transport system ATP-binding protein